MVEDKQEAQKTIVAFVVGLLIGGMIVWAFSGPTASAPESHDDSENKTEVKNEEGAAMEVESEATETKPALQVGNGAVSVSDQAVSSAIKLESVTYPISEGWIGVRDYNNDQLGAILGVVRFSEAQSLVPAEIILQRPTTVGSRYAVVIFSEDGDRSFNLAGDAQIDTIFDTFIAQ
jgi:hypothetical protein